VSIISTSFNLSRSPSVNGLRGLHACVFALGALPAGIMVLALLRGELGVNPVETLIHGTGIWALRLLLLTLAITPIRWLSGAVWVIRLRRQVGLWAFFYAFSHFSIFIIFEHSLVLSTIALDIIERPYILLGTSAFVLLLPLALTSTQGWMRRLGRNWKRLHRLIYPAALLGLLHFFWLIKANRWVEPLIYAALLAVMLGWRLWRRRSALWPTRFA